MRLFLDSSALAKRYIHEKGSEQVLLKCAKANEIILSILCIPETISAFNRLKREKKLSPKMYELLKVQLSSDINKATIIALGPSILRQTIKCLEKTKTRTLDALQIATAKEARCTLFLSADLKQCEAAKQMEIRVELI